MWKRFLMRYLSVPVFLLELHKLSLIQMLSVTHDALQFHFQDASGNGKHSDMHDKYPILIYIIYLIKKPSDGRGRAGDTSQRAPSSLSG